MHIQDTCLATEGSRMRPLVLYLCPCECFVHLPVVCAAWTVYMYICSAYMCSACVCLRGIHAQPSYLLATRHGAAAASPLTGCWNQHRILNTNKYLFCFVLLYFVLVFFHKLLLNIWLYPYLAYQSLRNLVFLFCFLF